MASYPDLVACGISYMQFSFHISGGLEGVDAFWEARGLDRSRERLLFAGYTRRGKPHTVYLQWARSHEGCVDVLLRLDARKPAVVWPYHPAKAYRLRESDLRDFIELARKLEVPWGIRARYAYPWGKGLDSVLLLPHARLTSLSFDVLDESQKAALHVTYEKRGAHNWLAIVEPSTRYPFPDDKNFFSIPYEMGCSLAVTIRKELPKAQ